MAKKARDGLFKRGGIWWIRTDPITKKAETTRCRDLEAARTERTKRERQAADPRHAAQAKETLESACDRMIETLEGMGQRTSFQSVKLGHWTRIVGRALPLADLGPEHFDLFVRARRSEDASNHTISKEVGCMLRALRLAKRVGSYGGDLTVLRPLDLSADYVPRTRALSPDEVLSLLEQLSPERWPFVALVVALGLRRSEAAALRPEHFDLELGIVHVPGTKTLGAKRTIPVLAPFRGLVEAAVGSVPLKPWSHGSDFRDLGVACKHAGIERCSWNDLRRTHATLLRSGGVDRDVTRRLLGHAPKSAMLEVVYDQPKPHELAARAGSLVTLTRQLAGATDEKVSGRGGLRSHDHWLVRPGPGEPGESSRALSASSEDGDGQGGAADVTMTRHPPAVHALALAAERVLNRRVFLVPGVRYRKAARRA